MDDQPVETTNRTKQKGQFSRRHLLKLLAAAGAAVAVDQLMPANWITPTASVSAGVDPGYPGFCTAAELPLTIINSNSTLVDAGIPRYLISFEYNEYGGLLGNKACLFANIINGDVIYNGDELDAAPGGFISPQVNIQVPKDCNNGSNVDNWYGQGHFYFNVPPANGTALDAVSADPIVLNWSLHQPEDRMSPAEETMAEPVAVTLSDFVVDSPGEVLKGAAVVAAAAGLGAVSVKALSKEEGENPE